MGEKRKRKLYFTAVIICLYCIESEKERRAGIWYHQRCENGELCEGDVRIHVIVLVPLHEQLLGGVAKALVPKKQIEHPLFVLKYINQKP
jgi:hypothetical protein